MADNGTGYFAWPDKNKYQDIIGDTLEEFTKVTNLNFQYLGYYDSINDAQNSNADFIYTIQNFGIDGAIALLFFHLINLQII